MCLPLHTLLDQQLPNTEVRNVRVGRSLSATSILPMIYHFTFDIIAMVLTIEQDRGSAYGSMWERCSRFR